MAALFLVAILPDRLASHPLHTSITLLSYERGTGSINISIRVFADDFARAAAQWSASHSSSRAGQSPLLAYIRSAFSIAAAGRAILLDWCGWRRQGDLVWLCFRAANAARGDIAIADRIFHDLYDDQINVVQAKSNGRSINLLFTKDDKPKLIR
jgi:hypothetical protein